MRRVELPEPRHCYKAITLSLYSVLDFSRFVNFTSPLVAEWSIQQQAAELIEQRRPGALGPAAKPFCRSHRAVKKR